MIDPKEREDCKSNNRITNKSELKSPIPFFLFYKIGRKRVELSKLQKFLSKIWCCLFIG